MDSQIPNWLQWVFGVLGFISAVGYIAEKVPRLRAYFRAPPEGDVARTKSNYIVGGFLALLCAVIWAASYTSLKLIDSTVGTLAINIHLMGFAALSLFISSKVARRFEAKGPSNQLQQLQSGRIGLLVVANLGNFVLSVWALSYISASEAMTLTNLSPLFLALALWYRGKLSPSAGTFLALALVALGTFLVNVDPGFVPRKGNAITGSVIAIAAGASFALWTFTMDELRASFETTSERMQTLALVFFISYVVLLTYSFFFAPAPPRLTTGDYTVLILNGLRVAVVHLLYVLAVKKAGPLLASVVVVLMVPMTFPFDSLWNKAVISIQLLVGSFLIVLAAVGLLSDELRRARAQPESPGA